MSVTYPRGFRAAGIEAGLKESGRPDLALLVSDAPAASAGAFTTNAFAAAPVTLTKQHLVSGKSRAVIVNSGQANAGTGPQGVKDAEAMAAAAAQELGFDQEEVLVCSTGVIGSRIPLDLIEGALPEAIGNLSQDGGTAFAEAILTTDTHPKEAVRDSGPYRIGGCVKGAGMIAPRLAPHPGLATMLVFLTTDAPLTDAVLHRIVAERITPVWNGYVVDSCQSTNDTVLVLASGAAGGDPVGDGTPEAAALGETFEAVCTDLARQAAADAEGATKALIVQVDGAPDRASARRVGLSVAGSPLVKTAVFGEDPNPGRILQAIGDAGVEIDPVLVGASLDGVPVLEGGVVVDREPPDAKEALQGPEVVVRISLGVGEGSATVFGCDLSYDYVRINSRYTT
jgi:glutamate N-acetyltransferase / amino-acid N-acetyltransferase